MVNGMIRGIHCNCVKSDAKDVEKILRKELLEGIREARKLVTMIRELIVELSQEVSEGSAVSGASIVGSCQKLKRRESATGRSLAALISGLL